MGCLEEAHPILPSQISSRLILEEHCGSQYRNDNQPIQSYRITKGFINDKPIDMFFDTGAEITTISKERLLSLCEGVQLQVIKCPQFQSPGTGAINEITKEAPCIKEFVVVNLKFQGLDFYYPVLVLSTTANNSQVLIIGNDVMRPLNMVILLNAEIKVNGVDNDSPDSGEKKRQCLSEGHHNINRCRAVEERARVLEARLKGVNLRSDRILCNEFPETSSMNDSLLDDRRTLGSRESWLVSTLNIVKPTYSASRQSIKDRYGRRRQPSKDVFRDDQLGIVDRIYDTFRELCCSITHRIHSILLSGVRYMFSCKLYTCLTRKGDHHTTITKEVREEGHSVGTRLSSIMPITYIMKSDGSIRICVDYRKNSGLPSMGSTKDVRVVSPIGEPNPKRISTVTYVRRYDQSLRVCITPNSTDYPAVVSSHLSIQEKDGVPPGIPKEATEEIDNDDQGHEEMETNRSSTCPEENKSHRFLQIPLGDLAGVAESEDYLKKTEPEAENIYEVQDNSYHPRTKVVIGIEADVTSPKEMNPDNDCFNPELCLCIQEKEDGQVNLPTQINGLNQDICWIKGDMPSSGEELILPVVDGNLWSSEDAVAFEGETRLLYRPEAMGIAPMKAENSEGEQST